MHERSSTPLSPHRAPVDLRPLGSETVLGESLALLFSAMMRLEFGASRGGTVDVSATWTSEEGAAVERAMSRVEAGKGDDARTTGQRDCDRFVAVAHLVVAAAARTAGRSAGGA
jgi:hypothetical protein